MTYYAAMAVVSAVITLVLSMVVMKLGYRFKLYPAIRDRDVHTRPTPRLGGVAMFAGILVAFAVASQVSWFGLVFDRPGPVIAILGAALMIVVIGVLDDVYDLDWMIKLAGQILAAGLLAWQGVAISSLPIGGLTVGSSQMSIMLTIFAIVLVMNAVNFIDGLDGLVAGVAIIANGAFFLYSFLLSDTATGQTERFNLASLISAILIGACLGFLPFNWHPAKLFMGDAGALLVGLLMATSAIAVTGEIDPNPETFGRSQLLPAFLPILLPFAILIVPLLDFALAVFRRLKAGKSPFSADRKHLHHRLLDMGHSRLHATLIFYAWTGVVSAGCLLMFVVQPYAWGVGFIVVGMIACAVITLAPLSRRKRLEAAAQLVPADAGSDDAAAYDPLDEAAGDRPLARMTESELQTVEREHAELAHSSPPTRPTDLPPAGDHKENA
ncbi:Decaprenyl-phosphate N-acetylglucosaminephosphotransferase [Clavibacter michiganensis]|uniref:Decaprenyl-phosphate N-acetylglucosaminephosphotransferase n=1 Tax=Clavibacter michiganensis TaxID=28447 RepID=A0A251YFZ9_9MICO|nr:MraY family glycosyltransferase [Clavibacter michiganensis]OUE23180.1 Decaprenyl-phosphate N-acetylglucosaminephosphotransferase [Clavibacter michiganensis]